MYSHEKQRARLEAMQALCDACSEARDEEYVLQQELGYAGLVELMEGLDAAIEHLQWISILIREGRYRSRFDFGAG